MIIKFQHTAARRRLPPYTSTHLLLPEVSTHSRPKAAALRGTRRSPISSSFNTQPPEGGCLRRQKPSRLFRSFNTQPPEGGCFQMERDARYCTSFNTQPPEGGC